MSTFVAGASGATGRLLVKQLLEKGEDVRVVVRDAKKFREVCGVDETNSKLQVTEGSLLDLSNAELQAQVSGCGAVMSCLGHNLTLKGMYGHPRKLCTDATRRLTDAINATKPATPVKYVLMNTCGNHNGDVKEEAASATWAHWALLGVIRMAIPPHGDNEQAAEYLRTKVKPETGKVEWVVVRPDGLVDSDTVSEYEVHPSPTRDCLFNSGTTSRINCANFMASLGQDDALWAKWRSCMPCVYNVEAPKK